MGRSMISHACYHLPSTKEVLKKNYRKNYTYSSLRIKVLQHKKMFANDKVIENIIYVVIPFLFISRQKVLQMLSTKKHKSVNVPLLGSQIHCLKQIAGSISFQLVLINGNLIFKRFCNSAIYFIALKC